MSAKGHENFSAVIASRYHPTGEQVMPHIACGADAEARLAERAEVAAKWAGVTPENLLVGVQQMSHNDGGVIAKRYAIPIAVAGEAQVWMTPTSGRSSTVSADFAEMVAKQHERAAMEANLQYQEALADGTQPV